MGDERPGPTERVAWTVFGLSLATSVLMGISVVIGDGDLFGVLAGSVSALNCGIWGGRILEARAQRSGRQALRP